VIPYSMRVPVTVGLDCELLYSYSLLLSSMLSLYANITLDKTGKQKTRVVLSFLPELVKITPFVSVFSGPVPHDGVLTWR